MKNNPDQNVSQMKRVTYGALALIFAYALFVSPCAAETPQEKLMRRRSCDIIVRRIAALPEGCLENGGTWTDECERLYQAWLNQFCWTFGAS